MTENSIYKKYREFIAAFNAITIAVLSGFGILYLQISTGNTVLYGQFFALAIGSGLAIIYILTEAKSIRLQKEKENRKELFEKVKGESENG